MKPKLGCILLIDDDEPTNFYNQYLVEKAGCAAHVQVAESGEEALHYLTKMPESANEASLFPRPDLIFLDINMPSMNGWEFLEKYKQLDTAQKAKIIVVMLTTSLFPEDLAKAKDMPEVSDFENKPLHPDALDRILKKYFS